MLPAVSQGEGRAAAARRCALKPEPAVSPLAVPAIERALAVERARHAYPGYARICGSTLVDLERQLEAARTGAPTWTDTAGVTWVAGGLQVGAAPSPPG